MCQKVNNNRTIGPFKKLLKLERVNDGYKLNIIHTIWKSTEKENKRRM